MGLNRRWAAFVSSAACLAAFAVGPPAVAADVRVNEPFASKAVFDWFVSVDASSTEAYTAVMAYADSQGAEHLLIRICPKTTRICTDYEHDLQPGEFVLSDFPGPNPVTTIKADVAGLGLVDIVSVRNSPTTNRVCRGGQANFLVTASRSVGITPALYSAGMQWGSKIGPWTNDSGFFCAFEGRYLAITWLDGNWRIPTDT